ncbi:MAG: hypothetical protein JXA33_27205 [Anaerolineae bacterium]|nr:hypothetical protein [Anaerolineae bacterium]
MKLNKRKFHLEHGRPSYARAGVDARFDETARDRTDGAGERVVGDAWQAAIIIDNA